MKPGLAYNPTVYHVGNLDGTREKPFYSQEGMGVSVGRDPETWRKIASGVSGKTYKLENSDSRFLLSAGDPHWWVIDWCVENAFIVRRTGWKAEWEDPEIQDTRYIVCYDREKAKRESQYEYREDVSLSKVEAYGLGERGREYWAEAFRSPPDEASPLQVKELAPVWYAKHSLDVDGVWWPEVYDPDNHSAPRGVIFQERLEDWEVSLVDSEEEVVAESG